MGILLKRYMNINENSYLDSTDENNQYKTHLKIKEYKRRESENFFADTKQKTIADMTFEDKEQIWWWKTSAISRNIWYYRDRFFAPRGPCTLPVLREAWTKGIIDDKTLVWATGLIDWIPIRNVVLLKTAIRTPEVQVVTWLKKKLVLEPQLHQVRQEQVHTRMIQSNQLELWN